MVVVVVGVADLDPHFLSLFPAAWPRPSRTYGVEARLRGMLWVGATGFLSLLTSDLKPIRQFQGAFGTGFTFLIGVLLIPAAIQLALKSVERSPAIELERLLPLLAHPRPAPPRGVGLVRVAAPPQLGIWLVHVANPMNSFSTP